MIHPQTTFHIYNLSGSLSPSNQKLNIHFARPPCCYFRFCWRNSLNKSCIFFEYLLPQKISGWQGQKFITLYRLALWPS